LGLARPNPVTVPSQVPIRQRLTQRADDLGQIAARHSRTRITSGADDEHGWARRDRGPDGRLHSAPASEVALRDQNTELRRRLDDMRAERDEYKQAADALARALNVLTIENDELRRKTSRTSQPAGPRPLVSLRRTARSLQFASWPASFLTCQARPHQPRQQRAATVRLSATPREPPDVMAPDYDPALSPGRFALTGIASRTCIVRQNEPLK
jgi:hypothetical protein